MYWLAIGVGGLTLIGGFIHSRFDGKDPQQHSSTHA